MICVTEGYHDEGKINCMIRPGILEMTKHQKHPRLPSQRHSSATPFDMWIINAHYARAGCHAQHLSEKFGLRERSAFIAPQWVSSLAWPLSPVEVGFHGSSKASK